MIITMIITIITIITTISHGSWRFGAKLGNKISQEYRLDRSVNNLDSWGDYIRCYVVRDARAWACSRILFFRESLEKILYYLPYFLLMSNRSSSRSKPYLVKEISFSHQYAVNRSGIRGKWRPPPRRRQDPNHAGLLFCLTDAEYIANCDRSQYPLMMTSVKVYYVFIICHPQYLGY